MQLAREIVQLESELALRRNEFERLAQDSEHLQHPMAESKQSVPDRPPLARTWSFPQKVQSIIDGSAKPLTAGDIAMRLGQPESIDTIRAVLSKLVGRGTIEREGVGLYRATHAGHKSAVSDDDD